MRSTVPDWKAVHESTSPPTRPVSKPRFRRPALTSLHRIPAMKRRPAITASRRPRSRTTSSDSRPRQRRRGRWQVARTAARSPAPNGPACPRPRHRRSAGSRPGPELSVPRPGSARRRDGPGSTPRAHQLLEPRRRPDRSAATFPAPPAGRTSTHRPDSRAGLRGWVVRPALCRAPRTTTPVADRPGGPPHPRLAGGGAEIAPSAPHKPPPSPNAVHIVQRRGGGLTGCPPQLVKRGRRHAVHRGGFRRRSRVRAKPCRRPAPTGCGCASPRSGGDHLRHAHPPALAGGRLHPVAQGGGGIWWNPAVENQATDRARFASASTATCSSTSSWRMN